MKKLIALLICYTLIITDSIAYNKLTILRPNGFNSFTQGLINDAEIEVTPRGIFAEIALTFTIAANVNSYKVQDSLEAVLNFDLPANSFIHDSWLWLDNTTIIVADIIEKNRAIAIYENIVKRRRDPSLLVKTGQNSYQLNVYPMTTAYPRKVKIVYSVPFNWRGNKVNAPIPLELFASSQIKPSILLKVNNSVQFSNPAFTDKDYTSFITGGTQSQQILTIPGAAYGVFENFHLSYETQMHDGIWLNSYSTGMNEGIYQLVVIPAAIGTNIGRNIAFMVDNDYKQSILPIDAVKQYISSFLMNELGNIDSFNIFYVSGNGSISSAFTNWTVVDAASISTAVSQLAAKNGISTAQYEDLLKQGISFTNSRPGAEGIVISQNTAFSSNQTAVNTAFGNIKTFVGNFSNRIHFVTNTISSFVSSAGTFIGNELLFSKLSLASGGNLYKYSFYKSSNGLAIYSLDLQNILKDLGSLSGYHTNTYNIDLQPANGFTFSEYPINGYERFSLSSAYVETGKYIRTIQPGTQVNIQVQSPASIMFSQQKNLVAVNSATINNKKSWVYSYIKQLMSTTFANEVIDSSISNRVLCDYTAFLAIETGDTLKTNVNDNENLKVETLNNTKTLNAACTPNPFTDKLTIEWDSDISAIEIYDFSGKKVFTYPVKKGDRKIQWNGTTNNGMILSSGLYIVVLKSENAPSVVLKALKL